MTGNSPPATLQETRGKVRVFKYRCTDCGKVNKSRDEAPDCMVHCERCGFPTVQTCQGVEVR